MHSIHSSYLGDMVSSRPGPGMLLLPVLWLLACSPPAWAKEAPRPPRPGVLRGDGLLHWGDGRRDLARSPFLPGGELVLVAWAGVDSCSWTTPGGETWWVEEGQVTGEEGLVEGVDAWEDEEGGCGVRVLVSSEQVEGGWLR